MGGELAGQVAEKGTEGDLHWGKHRISLVRTRHRELSGQTAEAKHGQGTGVTSGEADALRGGKTVTEAASEALGARCLPRTQGKQGELRRKATREYARGKGPVSG